MPTAPDLLPYAHTNYGDAQRFIAMFGDEVYYCPPMKEWLVYDGMRWAADVQDQARALAHEMMCEYERQAKAAGNEAARKWAAKGTNTERITDALREVQPYRGIMPDQLDTHPYLFNFRNGTMDLRTGRMWPPKREHLITAVAPFDYRPQSACPLFLGMVNRIVPGMESYIQKAAGCSMTGDTSEKKMFVCHGPGDNGKSTFLAALINAWGKDYATTIQIQTLMSKTLDSNAQDDLVGLRGKRLVVSSETNKNQRMNEATIKLLTQGTGWIKAAKKYQHMIEFPPTHKLWLDCNHKPVIKGTDKAIWNRLPLIPFEVTIPEDEQDKELSDKLRAEAEGILVWSVDGAQRWYVERLGTPAKVAAASAQWRTESDQLAQFITDCCVELPNASVRSSEAYKAYKTWAADNNEHIMTNTAFGIEVKARYQSERRTDGVWYLGVGLRVTP
jgi:putative DNA primase/helicase